MSPSPRPFPFALVLALILPHLGLAQQKNAQPKTLEILSYGRSMPGLHLITGKTDISINLGMMPPGPLIPIEGLTSVTLARSEPASDGGKPRKVPLLTIPLSEELTSPLVIVSKTVPATDGAPGLQSKIIDQNLPIAPRVLHFYNLTQVPMFVQVGREAQPVQVEPWGKVSLTPQTDNKQRAHVRIAYQSANGDWNIVKDSLSAFRAPFYSRYRVILAAEGLGEYADVHAAERKSAVVYLDEQSIVIPELLPQPKASEAPEYKPPYEKIEVVIPNPPKEAN